MNLKTQNFFLFILCLTVTACGKGSGPDQEVLNQFALDHYGTYVSDIDYGNNEPRVEFSIGKNREFSYLIYKTPEDSQASCYVVESGVLARIDVVTPQSIYRNYAYVTHLMQYEVQEIRVHEFSLNEPKCIASLPAWREGLPQKYTFEIEVVSRNHMRILSSVRIADPNWRSWKIRPEETLENNYYLKK